MDGAWESSSSGILCDSFVSIEAGRAKDISACSVQTSRWRTEVLYEVNPFIRVHLLLFLEAVSFAYINFTVRTWLSV